MLGKLVHRILKPLSCRGATDKAAPISLAGVGCALAAIESLQIVEVDKCRSKNGFKSLDWYCRRYQRLLPTTRTRCAWATRSTCQEPYPRGRTALSRRERSAPTCR